VDFLGAPLDDLVSGILDNKSVDYNKSFFSILTAYSFEKSNLRVEKHFLPFLHISGVLDGFARDSSSFNQGFLYFDNPLERLNSANDSEAILGFCDTVLFFSGFMPEVFNKKIVSKKYYEQLAMQGFYSLHKRSVGDSYFSLMAHFFRNYSGALSFMRKNLLDSSFVKDEGSVIN
jgi:hypothetical protein